MSRQGFPLNLYLYGLLRAGSGVAEIGGISAEGVSTKICDVW